MIKLLIGLVLLVGAGYGAVEAWPLFAGPALSITSPINDAVIADGSITVQGKAERVTTLTLDGSPLLYDQRGNFASTLTFPRGGSILSFEAIDRFGKKVLVTRTIFVP